MSWAATRNGLAGLCIGVGLAACTTSASPPDLTRPSPSLTLASPARCRPTPVGARADLLSLKDVWGSDNGGHATTVLDLRGCTGDAFSSTSFVCRLPFPWLSAADAPSQLAAMGAVRAAESRLVSPEGADVTETVIEFAPGARPGLTALRQQAAECGGTSDRRGDELSVAVVTPACVDDSRHR